MLNSWLILEIPIPKKGNNSKSFKATNFNLKSQTSRRWINSKSFKDSNYWWIIYIHTQGKPFYQKKYTHTYTRQG